MPNNLFSDFQPVSSKQWKQQIQFELKGADYNDIVWESPEGIKVRPFYHGDEMPPPLKTTVREKSFGICQDIFVFDIDKSIYRAKDSISRGAESLRLIIEDDKTDIAKILDSLSTANITIYIQLNFVNADFVKIIDAAAGNNSIMVLVDPVHQLLKDGNWFATKQKDNFEALAAISNTLKNCSIISVDARIYQNAGANIIQQVAYALAHANEYFNTIKNIKNPIVIQLAMGSNYFFEIAKLRATRILFDVIAKEYSHDATCHILATPTKRNKTLYDYNVNMLRSTTECMSAILGGADGVSNLPYDSLYHKSNEFGERISRNQLLILKHESYFDKVSNPADGSYYIESLTQQIADKALLLFKEIEAKGGLLAQVKDGTIQRKITESAEKEQALFDSGKEVLLGTNKYPNKNDRMAGELELFPFVKVKPRKTLITTIIEKRLAEKLEQERLQTEVQP